MLCVVRTFASISYSSQADEKATFKNQAEELNPSNLHKVKSVYDYRCYLGSSEKRYFLLSLGVS